MLRWAFILFMSFTLLAMVGCPGLYDSKRRAVASRHYFDSPNEMTKRALEAAKADDRREILICEIVMAAIFGLSLFTYVRFERRIWQDSA